MYILEREGQLGDAPLSTPKSVTWRSRSKPPSLRFLSLDNFGHNQFSLTEDHRNKLDILVKTVEASWKTMQPIGVIRLIGHTDNTGPEKYNVGLGDRRARAVEAALTAKLKGFMRPVAIVVEPSPGETEPTADNRTREGRAQNRRVEVFITSGGLPIIPEPPTETEKPIDWTPPPPPDDPYGFRKKRGDGPPNGKSLKDRLNKILARLPSWLRGRVSDAVISGACFTLTGLLEQSALGGADKDALMAACKATAQTKSR